jgi:hypothetical protein
MMNTKLIFLFALLIIVSGGCAFAGVLGGLGGSKKPSTIVTQDSLKTGTDSLVMSFYPGSPPNETYSDGQIFEVAINVANRGASNITNGKIVVNYDSTFLDLTDEPWVDMNQLGTQQLVKGNTIKLTPASNLAGKSLDNPEGSSTIYSKNFKTKSLFGQVKSQEVNFIVTACYDYKTSKGIPICLDPEPLKKTQKPCVMGAVTMQGQGAPLVITKVEPKLVKKADKKYELEVLVYFQNKGRGQIYKKGMSDTACGSGGFSDEKNFWNTINEETVQMSLSTEAGNQFECGPFPIRLSEKESFFRCVYKSSITQTQPYSTILFIDMSYGYMQSISQKMIVSRRTRI